MLHITDIIMLLTNGLVLFFVIGKQKDNKILYWSIITFIFTYFIELAGIRTGQIFGEYHYGSTMQIQILKVPIVIGMNWVILMLGSYSLASWTKINRTLVPVLSSVFIVGFDIIMENVAMKLDYWQWAENKIPLQNYISWFFISLIFSSILALLKVNIESKILRVYFIVQLLFFMTLRILLK
jgi:putative membrane protein